MNWFSEQWVASRGGGARRPWLLLAGALALALLVVVNLPRLMYPLRVVGLVNTVWHIESLDRHPLDDLAATMTFVRGEPAQAGDLGDLFAFVDSACGRRTFGYDLEEWGTSIGFWLLSTQARACLPAAATEEQRIVAGLELIDHWGVESDNLIELRGEYPIGLRRSALPEPSGTGRTPSETIVGLRFVT